MKNMVYFLNFFEKSFKNKIKIKEFFNINEYYVYENSLIDRKKLHPEVYEYIENNEIYYYSPVLERKRKNNFYSKFGISFLSIFIVFIGVKIYVKPRFKS
jgi:hypothetical protein